MTNKEETTPLGAEEVLKLQNELQNLKEKWAFSQQWLYKLTDQNKHLKEGLNEITTMHGNEETLRKVAAEYLEEFADKPSPQVEDRIVYVPIKVEDELPDEAGEYFVATTLTDHLDCFWDKEKQEWDGDLRGTADAPERITEWLKPVNLSTPNSLSMGVITYKLKTHSRVNITNEVGQLNDCIVHNKKPEIFEMVVGRDKEVFYTATCEHDDCGKITSDENEIAAIWNKFNPIK